MDPLADREYWQIIWDKFRTGDRGAFETIYNEFIDVLFSYGSRITSNREILEDAVQDLFIDIYNYGSRLQKPESLEFYLFKTLKRNIYRKLKVNNHYAYPGELTEKFELTFSMEESEEDFSDEQLTQLRSELQRLDARQRELLFLKFNSGLTYKEMGTLLGLNPDTVKKQVYRLLGLLRKRLGENILELFVVVNRQKL